MAARNRKKELQSLYFQELAGIHARYLEYMESWNENTNVEFQFTRPLEAPVFCPTEEEFQDPLAYLNKIRPSAERAGICKIKPPASWQPPFAADVELFKFTPRVQRINELEAKTRVKLNFLDQIAKFWELQGSSLKIPIVDRKALDLYTLHKLVQSDGGHEKINNEKKWNRLAVRMGYNPTKNYGLLLKSHYDKILFPFDLFQINKLNGTDGKEVPSPRKGSPMKSKQPASPMRSKNASPTKMGTKIKGDVVVEDQGVPGIENTSKELRRLAFYGAGPKMAGFNIKSSQNLQLNQDGSGKSKTKTQLHDILEKYVCLRCKKGDSEDSMLLCDGCDDSYHTFCLLPPLPEVPKGEWRCPQCVAEEVCKPSEAFGFEQAQREYTLTQFGQMADHFKTSYFNQPLHLIDLAVVEREFWRITSAIDEDVTVEYGADLHSMDHGSGFPTEGSSNQLSHQNYIKSAWNLNNLPVLAGSVLGHINADISGMKVPWMYVGMCFSTFCWHNEDHWSYSINYLHWGEPKTWYGVPGSRADDFENAMKAAAPELFQSQPDLLHQLVTIMNPNILMRAGVPVYRMDQQQGEFIVTFPRAYHAGFNQGYNFAEAVNFAPPDWLAMGRNCVEHYSTLHRYCVFSHDELVCKMSTEANELTLMVAMATYKDVLTMLESERGFRKAVSTWGVTNSERKAYELLPDDERLCDFCKTTCFLSAIVCSCTNRLACLRHYDKLCDCPASAHTLMYRYTLDEIPAMMEKLKDRTVEYDNWVTQLNTGLSAKIPEDRIDLEELKQLLLDAETKGYPKTPLRDMAINVMEEAEKCVVIAQQLVYPALKTKTRNSTDRIKLRLDELQLFADQMNNLNVKLKVEMGLVGQLLENVKNFKFMAMDLLRQSQPNIDHLKVCLDRGLAMDIDLEELPLVRSCLERTKWITMVDGMFDAEGLWTVQHLDKAIEEGQQLEKVDKVQRRLNKVMALKNVLHCWEERSLKLQENLRSCKIKDLENLLLEAKRLNLALPSLPAIRSLAKKAKEHAEALKLGENPDMSLSDMNAAMQLRNNEGLKESDGNAGQKTGDDIEEFSHEKPKRKCVKPLPKPTRTTRPSTSNKEKDAKRRKTVTMNKVVGGEVNLEDDDDKCASPQCLRPTGKIGWVYCDAGCQGWFHLICVGITQKQAQAMPRYECSMCKPPKENCDDGSRGSGSVSKIEDLVINSNKENSYEQKMDRVSLNLQKLIDAKLDALPDEDLAMAEFSEAESTTSEPEVKYSIPEAQSSQYEPSNDGTKNHVDSDEDKKEAIMPAS